MKTCRKGLHSYAGNQCPTCKRERETSPSYREEKMLRARAWRKLNPKLASYNKKLRRIAKMQRTPKWLTKEEKQAIKQFYLNCPDGFHVDHIIPLRGEEISGLHVLTNLQYMDGTENRIKGNRYA